LDPANMYLTHFKLSSLMALKRYDQVIEVGSIFFKLVPSISNFEAYITIASAFMAKKQFDKAKFLFDEIEKLKFHPDCTMPLKPFLKMYSGVNKQFLGNSLGALCDLEIADKTLDDFPDYFGWFNSVEISSIQLTMARVRCFLVLRLIRLVCISQLSYVKNRKFLLYSILRTTTKTWLNANQFHRLFEFACDRNTLSSTFKSNPEKLAIHLQLFPVIKK